MRLLFEGLGLGLAYSMPIGIQNLFVIRQALTGARSTAFFTAACVSLADITLTLACFFGAGRLLHAVPAVRLALLLGGAAFLAYKGVELMLTPGTLGRTNQTHFGRRAIARAALIFTWLNPQALVDGSILLGGYSAKLDPADAPVFLLGLTLAAPVWFGGLTSVGLFSAAWLTPRWMTWINRLSAVIMLALAATLVRAAFE